MPGGQEGWEARVVGWMPGGQEAERLTCPKVRDFMALEAWVLRGLLPAYRQLIAGFKGPRR